MKPFSLLLGAWSALFGKKKASQIFLRLLAKSGNPKDDQLVLPALELVKEAFQRNKKLCLKISAHSAAVSIIGLIQLYTLKLASELETGELKIILLVWAFELETGELKIILLVMVALFSALTNQGYFFQHTFNLGGILKARIGKVISRAIGQKLSIANREKLREYVNDNGTPSSLEESISTAVGNDLPVVPKDLFIFAFYVLGTWMFFSWEYALALVVFCVLSLRLSKPALRKHQEIGKEAGKLKSKKQTITDDWTNYPRLHSDRGICRSRAQKLDVVSDEEVALHQDNAFQRTWLQSGPRSLGIFLLLSLMLPYAFFTQERGGFDAILIVWLVTSALAGWFSAVDFTFRLADKLGDLLKLGKFLELPHRKQGNVPMKGFRGFSLQGVKIHYKDRTLFPKGLDLKIHSGPPGKANKIALVGASGSGKSSLVRLLARDLENIPGESSRWTGKLSVRTDRQIVEMPVFTREVNRQWSGKCLVRMYQQEVEIEQTRLESYPQYVVMVPQETELLASLSIAGNIGLTLEEDKTRTPEEKQQVITQLAEALGLDGLGKKAQEQSGGQQKRTQIGSALAMAKDEPIALLFDEASSQLDQPTATFVAKVSERIIDLTGGAYILIAHSEYSIPDDCYVIVLGSAGEGIVEQGWKQDLAVNPASAYRELFPA
jgi:ABC-type methionine transport system ATPase subunit